MIPTETKLLNMLSNNDVTFFIPPYQRNYEWTDDQCKVFLDDVIKTYQINMEGKSSEHFFGSITFFETEAAFGQPHKLVLIDGQQRITTTMLFLVALRDIIEDKTIGDFIDSRYLKNNNVTGDGEYKVKLKQVETDWAAYRNIILGDELTNDEKNSAVYRNYRYFCNKLSDCKSEGMDLAKIIDKGLNRFSVITIQLEPDKNPWENPQEIFESMNSLGKPLSLADLVRNYLLLGLDADTQSFLYSQYWLHIERTIPNQVSNFIRDFMQAHECRPYLKATETNYKELYGLFKSTFSEENPKVLLKDLAESATIYSWLLPGGSCGNAKIDQQLQDLSRMNVTTAYSFLLELLRAWKLGKINAQDTADVLDAFRIYCMRKRLLGITGAENKNFPVLAAKVTDLANTEDKKTKMFEILSKQESNLRLPNDVELSRFLETMNFFNFRYCRFFLALIEEKLTKSRPDLNDEKLQIEHIMPQKLSDEWEKALGDDHEAVHQELVNTIGNLTLIRHNQELGNKPFAEKKQIYETKSGLQIARTEITNQQKWTAEEIRQRTVWIINYLLSEVLPIPDKMRRTNNFNPKEGRKLSFLDLQLIGLDIDFTYDTSIHAHVISDKEVEFEGKKWKLTPLTKELQTRRGKANQSGSYNPAWFWEYDGIRLADIM